MYTITTTVLEEFEVITNNHTNWPNTFGSLMHSISDTLNQQNGVTIALSLLSTP